jgi:threonine/homoserine/homoserine lactone efflux protein
VLREVKSAAVRLMGYIATVVFSKGFTMSYFPQLFAVAAVMLLGCISPGPDLIAATIGIVASISLGWFSAMAVLFLTRRVQHGYHPLRKPIDAAMETILIGLGAKLAMDR